MQSIKKLGNNLRGGLVVDTILWDMSVKKASHRTRRHKMSKKEFVQRMLQDRADADA